MLPTQSPQASCTLYGPTALVPIPTRPGQGALHAPQDCVHGSLEGRRARSGVGTCRSVWPRKVHVPLWSWTHAGLEQGSDPGPGPWGDPSSLHGPWGAASPGDVHGGPSCQRCRRRLCWLEALRSSFLRLFILIFTILQPVQKWTAGTAPRVSARRWRLDTLLSPLFLVPGSGAGHLGADRPCGDQGWGTVMESHSRLLPSAQRGRGTGVPRQFCHPDWSGPAPGWGLREGGHGDLGSCT